MHKLTIAVLAASLSAGVAMAQTNGPASSQSLAHAVPTKGSSASGSGGGTSGMAGLLPGSNSFTESQAKSRMSNAGYGNVTDLKKDRQGIWRGKAQKDGKSVNVGLDYKGNIASQ